MGLMDNIKDAADKGKDLVEKQGDAIADGVDKATDFVDDKTGGKYTEHLDKVDGLADKLRDGDAPAE